MRSSRAAVWAGVALAGGCAASGPIASVEQPAPPPSVRPASHAREFALVPEHVWLYSAPGTPGAQRARVAPPSRARPAFARVVRVLDDDGDAAGEWLAVETVSDSAPRRHCQLGL